MTKISNCVGSLGPAFEFEAKKQLGTLVGFRSGLTSSSLKSQRGPEPLLFSPELVTLRDNQGPWSMDQEPCFNYCYTSYEVAIVTSHGCDGIAARAGELESKVLQQVLPPSQQVEHGNTIRIQQQGFVSKIQKNP